MIGVNHETLSSSSVDGDQLRKVCGHFATGVTVIASGGADNPAATTVNSFTSVSLEPPLVLFCLHIRSRLLPVVRSSGGFTVNFLARGHESLAWAFAGGRSAMFDGVPHRRSSNGLPVLSQAPAFVACRLAQEYDGGDHAIMLGEVVELGMTAAADDPLVFYRGSMRRLAGDSGGQESWDALYW